MIEPTEENITLFILARGFCPKCGGPPDQVVKYPSKYYCSSCWSAVVETHGKAWDCAHTIWRDTTNAWGEAFKKYNVT